MRRVDTAFVVVCCALHWVGLCWPAATVVSWIGPFVAWASGCGQRDHSGCAPRTAAYAAFVVVRSALVAEALCANRWVAFAMCAAGYLRTFGFQGPLPFPGAHVEIPIATICSMILFAAFPTVCLRHIAALATMDLLDLRRNRMAARCLLLRALARFPRARVAAYRRLVQAYAPRVDSERPQAEAVLPHLRVREVAAIACAYCDCLPVTAGLRARQPEVDAAAARFAGPGARLRPVLCGPVAAPHWIRAQEGEIWEAECNAPRASPRVLVVVADDEYVCVCIPPPGRGLVEAHVVRDATYRCIPRLSFPIGKLVHAQSGVSVANGHLWLQWSRTANPMLVDDTAGGPYVVDRPTSMVLYEVVRGDSVAGRA